MIKLADFIPKLSINEASIHGALEGWLEPNGECHYVPDTHAEWIARYFNIKPPDETDVGSFENRSMVLKRMLYDKGWVRVVIKHDDNLLYFDTFNISWKQLTSAQRRWILNASIYGTKIEGGKISIGDETNFRDPPYKIQFGNSGETISPDDILERIK